MDGGIIIPFTIQIGVIQRFWWQSESEAVVDVVRGTEHQSGRTCRRDASIRRIDKANRPVAALAIAPVLI